MSTIERAIEIAAAAHAGQMDKGGEPYILHPLKVMLRVTTEYERISAVLHDVIEDSNVTIEQLRSEGFPEEVLRALTALTKLSGESRIEAAKRASLDPIARIVKLADNAENMDLSRIPNPSNSDFQRLEEYKAVRALLLAAGEA
jgi:GTP diphosphokinase / guanosine-3',5'-bis(diphosphate) 3'-diphosphatase